MQPTIRELLTIVEAKDALVDQLLLIVHPGSCGESADWNLGEELAAEDRQKLADEIQGWNGPALVVVDRDAPRLRAYPELAQAIAQKKPKKVRGDIEQPDWVEAATKAVQRLCAPGATIAITGAWSGPGGCCNAMEMALKVAGYRASILPGAMRSDMDVDEATLSEVTQVDAVVGGADGFYQDREVAVFNPSAVSFVGYFNKMTKQIDPKLPIYPKGFYFNWNSETDA